MGHTINGVTVRKSIPNAGAHLPKGQKIDARNAEGDLKLAVQKEIEKTRNADIPEKKKNALIDKLKKRLKRLNNPKGKIAKRYNQLLRALRTAHESRATAEKKYTAEKVDQTVDVGRPKSEKTNGDADGRSSAFDNFDPERFTNLMMDNPQAAFEKLDSMKNKERVFAMKQAQNHMQKIQQMSQLQSNLSKLMHQTNSSVIRNIS